MGFLASVSSVASPGRLRAADESGDPFARLYTGYVPAEWYGQLSRAGVRVSPELALTLSAVWCAVTTIADDIATQPCHIFRYRDDGGKDRVRRFERGLGLDPYKLRWQPNVWQTAKEFWGLLIGHLLLRGNGYAEIVEGPSGFADQLVPLHPDRVKPRRLPSGRVRYRLIRGNADGSDRYLTQDQVFHIRELSGDGVLGMSRISYGLQSLGASLAQEYYTQRFFKQGATASVAVINKSGHELDDEPAADLHANIAKYLTGAENAGGVLYLDADMDIKALGIEPEKAQLLGARDFSVRDVARWFKMPAHKLEAAVQSQAYAAREQANLEYVIGCLRPIDIGIEQTIQRDLIVQKEDYFAEFLLDALLRGDTKARAEYYEKAIRNRWMRPSEVRMRENMNPDPQLDALSERDFQPGQTGSRRRGRDSEPAARRDLALPVRAMLLAHDTALRIVRKEKDAIAKGARKHASDGEGWAQFLRTFYADHAGFVAHTLRLSPDAAREYCAEHGTALEQAPNGIEVMADWEHTETAALVELWAQEGSKAA